jgi:glycosyltransferase involved in cell wall biosynthesis
LHKDLPDSTFTIAGTGTDADRLKKLATTLELHDSVRWLGGVPQEQLWTYYERCTVFVFPSLHDSAGTVILEALSQALPVICLDTGGPGEILPPSCGFKVPVQNRSEEEVVADLKTAMKMLADSPELRARMGRCALEFATGCTWTKIVSGAYAHIEQSIGKARNMSVEPNE